MKITDRLFLKAKKKQCECRFYHQTMSHIAGHLKTGAEAEECVSTINSCWKLTLMFTFFSCKEKRSRFTKNMSMFGERRSFSSSNHLNAPQLSHLLFFLWQEWASTAFCHAEVLILAMSFQIKTTFPILSTICHCEKLWKFYLRVLGATKERPSV